MRTIKFRGKRKSDGAWLYGYYNREVDGTIGIILPNQDEYVVEAETVGQLIAVDENGREVFEGDRLKYFGEREADTLIATFDDYRNIIDGILVLAEAQS